MRKILLLLLGVLIALPAIAHDFSNTHGRIEFLYTIIDEDAKTCEVTGCLFYKNPEEIVIPATALNGDTEYSVTSIGDRAFYDYWWVKSFTLPESITSIGHIAFGYCGALTSINIPESVTSIGNAAFSNCGALTSINIPESVTSIGNGAFQWCVNLTSVNIPEAVTSIGDGTFMNCRVLTSINIPKAVTSIGSQAFEDCRSLTSINIPEAVTSIGDRIFYNCEALTSVNFPEALTSIGNSAFSYCKSLTSLNLPNNVNSIGSQAFYYCYNLTAINIPEAVSAIKKETFFNCSSLTSIIIPEAVTSIGSSAFQKCGGLTSVIIPNKVTYAASNAFNECNRLVKSAYPSGVSNPFNNGIAIEYPREGAVIEEGFVFGPEKSSIYFAPLSLEGNLVIPSTVTSIESQAFHSCIGLTSAVLPSSISSIGSGAFDNCTALASINIPEAVSVIEQETFYNCQSLTSITIPDAVTTIGTRAFSLSGLTSVIIPAKVTNTNSSFEKCHGLVKSAYPSGVSNPFNNGIAIEYPREGAVIEDGFVFSPEKSSIYFAPLSLEGDLVVPSTVTSIESHAFHGCSDLTSATIPSSVTSIGQSAFSECEKITSVTSNAVVPPTMADDAFTGLYDSATLSIVDGTIDAYLATSWSHFKNLREGDKAVEDVTYTYNGLTYRLIPAKDENQRNLAVLMPGDYSSFNEVTIPERITIDNGGNNTRYYVDAIGYKAFDGCSSLNTVTFSSRNAAKLIGDRAFAGTKFSTINIPETVETVGRHAFDGNSSLTEITLPSGVRTIDSYAFAGCYSLKGFNIPEGVATIRDYTFTDCTSLTEITIPASIETIGEYAFNNCSSLTDVTIESGVKTLADHAFDKCTSLTQITVPGTIETIGKYAFNNCSSLTDVTIESGVRNIGDFAFYDTSSLSKVTLNEGLETIGQSAFASSSFKRIQPFYMPSTITTVGKDAFYYFGCNDINISSLEAWCNIDFENSASNPGSCTANGNASMYLNNKRIKNLVIPESVKVVKDYTFCYYAGLESITFNDGVERIGNVSFYGCIDLKNVTIPGSVTEIGRQAFDETSPAVTFTYGAEPIEIADNAFPDGMPWSWSPYIPSLSWDRPLDCLNIKTSRLESLTLGNSVTEIPAGRFKNIDKLTTLTLSTGLTTIGDEAFSGCTTLNEIILPPTVETIGASAFADNPALATIIMGHSVKSIGEKAFSGCQASTVSITAQTPPSASDNTFSSYDGNLYVQGQKAADAYYDADFCWFQFEGHVMIEATELKIEEDNKLSGKPGDTFQLTATLLPENVTLPQIFWRSTNPEIATVDPTGLVTLHADLDKVMAMAETDDSTPRTCKIIAESLYADGPIAEVEIIDMSAGIDNVISDNDDNDTIDYNAPVEVYNINGMRVADSVDGLATGLYIVRQGNTVQKISVK